MTILSFQQKDPRTQSFPLSPSYPMGQFPFGRTYHISQVSCLAIAVASLWLFEISPLKAMEPECSDGTEVINKTSSGMKRSLIREEGGPVQKRQKVIRSTDISEQASTSLATSFYKDAQHPLTEDFWKKRDLSKRLQDIEIYFREIKKELEANSFIDFDSNYCKNILKILSCNNFQKYLGDPLFDNLLINSENLQKSNAGCTGNDVSIFFDGNIKIVTKKFKNIKEGLKELIYSLLALNANPSPQKLKMARIYDAYIDSENYLNIIMEGANTYDIEHFLSGSAAIEAISACAEYLATFHIKNYKKLRVNPKKYIKHVSKAFNTLHDPLNELFFLSTSDQWVGVGESDFTTISRYLSTETREKFLHLLKKCLKLFEENSSVIYRSLSNSNEKQVPYFSTITHGDAHKNNFFYVNTQLLQHVCDIPKTSPKRVTMIDYATILRTYDGISGIGDPAEDVGRLLGSIWDWAACQRSYEELVGCGELCSYKKIYDLQTQFISSYLNKVKKSCMFPGEDQKIFEEFFRENINFYKLRFYKLIFNTSEEKKDVRVKLKLLNSWIWENSHLGVTAPDMLDDSFSDVLDASFPEAEQRCTPQKQPNDQRYGEMDNKNVTCCYLPSPVANFIEAAAEGSEKTYLTLLRDSFHPTEDITHSSVESVITGMGGVGKTSLALAYAHEALENKTYNLIYWFSAETRSSLLKGYRNLLRDMGISTKDTDEKRIIELIKENLTAKDRCLLIYDNVAGSDLLTGIIPEQNIDILITSRCDKVWKNKPLNINVFYPEYSVKYLLNTTNLQSSYENKIAAKRLAEELAHFPLALSHAVHYINLEAGKNISANSFEKYIEKFRKRFPLHFEMHQNPFKDESRKLTFENVVARTFRISNTTLSDEARELLAYCSYLNPEAIEEDILLQFYDKKKLYAALTELTTLSLITKVNNKSLFSIVNRTQNKSLFAIHPLLQIVVRNDRPFLESRTIFLNFFTKLNKIFEENSQTNEQLDQLTNYIPHFFYVFKYISHSHEYAKILESFPEQIKRFKLLVTILYYFENLVPEASADYDEIRDTKLTKIVKIIEDIKGGLEVGESDNLSEWLETISDKCHPKILCALGLMYSEQLDHEKALLWFSKAANRQDSNGQFHLAETYQRLYWKERDKKNLKAAVEWYDKAAQQQHKQAQIEQCRLLAHEGDRDSQFYLGQIYQLGLGVEQSDREAFKWYTAAAEGGHADAQFSLGELYFYGQGVQQNRVKASQWFRMVFGKRQADARYYLRKIGESSL